MLYSNLYMVVLSCYASLLAWFFLACLLVSVWLWSLLIFLVMLALLACIINCLHKRSLSASFSQADLIHLDNWIPGGPFILERCTWQSCMRTQYFQSRNTCSGSSPMSMSVYKLPRYPCSCFSHGIYSLFRERESN